MVFIKKTDDVTEIVHENGIVLGQIVRLSNGRHYMAERERNFWTSGCLREIANHIDELNK